MSLFRKLALLLRRSRFRSELDEEMADCAGSGLCRHLWLRRGSETARFTISLSVRVVAYSVAQRRQEIGVRMALSATRRQISILFLRRTLTAALIGLACGCVATLMVTRLLRSQLYGVEPNNPRTFLIAILLLLTPVLVASLRPALQAASVDPVEALRTE